MAVPTRPVQDAIISPEWGQWVHDNTVRTLAIRALTVGPRPTDASGVFSVNASEFGLTAITGAIAMAGNSSPGTYTITLSEVYANGTNVFGRLMLNSPPSNLSWLSNHGGVTTHWIAWGTVAATLLPAPEPPELAKPGPDEEAEPK